MGDRTVAQSAQERARSIPLDEIDVSDPELWRTDSHWPYFERLRPRTRCTTAAIAEFGPYWSITKYNDIMAVDTNHQVFSSEAELGGITIDDADAASCGSPMFIAMDPPKHDVQRKTVSPAVSPANLQLLEPLIRERAGKDPRRPADRRDLRLGRRVSIELTTHDAGHPVRLPVRGAPQADLLVRRGRRRRPGPASSSETYEEKAAVGDGVSRLLHRTLERAGQRAADAAT